MRSPSAASDRGNGRRVDSTSEPAWKGLDASVLAEAGVEVNTSGVIRIPYRHPSGEVFRSRFYAPDRRTWWGPGNGLIPLGLETLPGPEAAARSILFVAEGESDCLALRGALTDSLARRRTSPSYAIAVPGAHAWAPEWRRHLEHFLVIYLLGDGDRSGQEMNARIKLDAPWARAVRLPDGQDVRSILQGHGPDALDPLLDATDSDARLSAAMLLARNIDECEALLRDGDVSG